MVESEVEGALSGSTLWGFGSAVALEHGDLTVRLLDLDPAGSVSAAAVAEELLFPDRESRVALRGGGRQVARLVRGPLPGGCGRGGLRRRRVRGGSAGIGPTW